MITRLLARVAVWICVKIGGHDATINRRRAWCMNCQYHYTLEE